MPRQPSMTRCALFAGVLGTAAAAMLSCAAAGPAKRSEKPSAAPVPARAPAPPLPGTSTSTHTTRRIVTAPDGTTTITEEVTVVKDGQTTRTVTTRTAGGTPGTTAVSSPDPRAAAAATMPAAAPVDVARDGAALVNEALLAHNRERQAHNVPNLRWDPALARLAQDWANHLCQGGRGFSALEHRPQRQGGPGENLWAGFTSEAQTYPAQDAIKGWNDERKYYDARTGQCRVGECRHYTQVVWHSTTHVGCAVATCPSSGMHSTVWVCNYSPAGNLEGERAY